MISKEFCTFRGKKSLRVGEYKKRLFHGYIHQCKKYCTESDQMFIWLLCYPQVFRVDKYVVYFERNSVVALWWIFSDSEKS